MINYPPRLPSCSWNWRMIFMVMVAALSSFMEPTLEPSFSATMRCEDKSLDYEIGFTTLELGGQHIKLCCGEKEVLVEINSLKGSFLPKLSFSFRILYNVIALYSRHKNLGQNRASKMVGVISILIMLSLDIVPFLIILKLDGVQKFYLRASGILIVNIVFNNIYNIVMGLLLIIP